MQTKSPPRMQVVKCDDKKDKLIAFISEHFERRMSAGDDGSPDELQVVALSVNSPVVGALQYFAARQEIAGAKIQLIVADTSSEELLQQLAVFDTISVRWAQNIRLLDAHEQLVLSDSCCWTGDCMRREPAKRDAFECFADDCKETARWARISFDRLWSVSIPLMGSDDSAETDSTDADGVVAVLEKNSDTSVIGTLH
ncbi:MAG: hypothetical protein AAF709_08190 [Pseudomonadota bacterium]